MAPKNLVVALRISVFTHFHKGRHPDTAGDPQWSLYPVRCAGIRTYNAVLLFECEVSSRASSDWARGLYLVVMFWNVVEPDWKAWVVESRSWGFIVKPCNLSILSFLSVGALWPVASLFCCYAWWTVSLLKPWPKINTSLNCIGYRMGKSMDTCTLERLSTFILLWAWQLSISLTRLIFL